MGPSLDRLNVFLISLGSKELYLFKANSIVINDFG